MARFHLVMVHARTKLQMIAIEPRGQGAFDAKANVIRTKFGPETMRSSAFFVPARPAGAPIRPTPPRGTGHAVPGAPGHLGVVEDAHLRHVRPLVHEGVHGAAEAVQLPIGSVAREFLAKRDHRFRRRHGIGPAVEGDDLGPDRSD